MSVPELLALGVIVIAAPANWLVVLLLWRWSRRDPQLQTLRERAITATALALIVTIFALVFLNNGMEIPTLDSFATMVVTRAAVLALSIPALYWLWLYRGGRRR